LTDRDFRFQCRVWFLGRTPSICPGCSRGCNIEIHYNERFNARYHDKRVHRLKPRYNREVNGFWLCDEGRYAYHSIDSPDRLKTPKVKRDGSLCQAEWAEAIEATVAALRQALQHHGPDAVAVLASPQMSNEELFTLRRLFRDLLKIDRIEHQVPLSGPVSSDDFLMTPDKNPNSRGAETLGLGRGGSGELLRDCARGQVRFLYICHHDLTRGHDGQEVRDALSRVDFVAFQGSFAQPTAELAHVQLPSAVCAEKDGTFTNIQGRVQRIHAAVPPVGESLPDLSILASLASALGLQPGAVAASEVFREIGRSVQPFAGMTYETLGSTGQLLR
jgi:NADH-quinone oxidoreductase subunit G